MVTIDELEQRVRRLELDSRSDHDVSRQTLEQLVKIASTVNLSRLEQISQAGQIGQLQQDTTVIRNETVALRGGQEKIHARIDAVEASMEAKFAEVLEAIRAIAR